MRVNGSYSRKLADNLINQLCNHQHSDRKTNHVISRDLANGIPLINDNWIKANITPYEERTSTQHQQLALSDVLIEELKSADQLVIALPIYNFGVPAAFKAWIDLVARSKITFKYTETGTIGLLTVKKAYIIVTSGGTKLGSELDFISGYLRHVLGFIGINDVTMIDSSGLGRNEEQTLEDANKIIEGI